MTRQPDRSGLKSEERRRFLEISTKYGYSVRTIQAKKRSAEAWFREFLLGN